MELLENARDVGATAVDDLWQSVRGTVRHQVRSSLGVRGTPPARCDDPTMSYLPVDGAARAVHGDLPAMLVGGIASLLLQILHPSVMTGVAQHSRYREDPLGRLARTASFVGTTTFGSSADARASIARVRAVHARVYGATSEGESYRADDPRLLEWVHVSELAMFAAGVRAYGPGRFDDEIYDRYVAEMAVVARDLGVPDPPRSQAELDERLEGFRPTLRLVDEGREARDFVLRGVSASPARRAAYTTLAAAAVGVLPPWARRQLEITTVPWANELVVRPVATALCATLRLAVTSERQVAIVSPPSTATT